MDILQYQKGKRRKRKIKNNRDLMMREIENIRDLMMREIEIEYKMY